MADLAGIGHVHLIVADHERAARFYGDAFGLKEHFRVRDRLVFMGTDDATLIVLDAEQTAAGKGGIDHLGLTLASGQDLDAAVDDVVSAGGRVVQRGEHEPGMPFAYVTDPDGNLLEL
ncbi:MAG TPA: VOC family protein [Jatrophihabitantaceae bacterium]